MIFAFDRSVCS